MPKSLYKYFLIFALSGASAGAFSQTVGGPDGNAGTAHAAPTMNYAMLESLPTVKLRPASPKSTLQLRTEEAEARYIEGLVALSLGEVRRAHLALLDAAKGGHAPAQRKLGEIYDRGNAVVDRDYAEALRWYGRARAQGEYIPTPHTLRSVPFAK